jgi:Spy/CpxP family protein refolding chaperone
MNKTFASLLFVAAMVVASSASAADDKIADVTEMQALRNAVKADRRAFVASTLRLTDGQAKKFWPIYDAYQRSVDSVNRKRVMAVESLIVRDRPVTDLYAKTLANDLLAADEAELRARRTMQRRVMRALPPLKAARYLQLESKIRALQAYDIAASIPLIR